MDRACPGRVVLTCREFAEFLWKYLENELPRGQRARFDSHLSICPACVRYLSTYAETIRLGTLSSKSYDVVSEEVPAELLAAVMDTLRTGSSR